MAERIVFHGSFVAVPKPEIRTDGFANQIVFCTPAALTRISFNGSYAL